MLELRSDTQIRERLAAYQQRAIPAFDKVNRASFDAPENRAGIGSRKRGCLIRRDHQSLGLTLPAPGNEALPANVNCGSFVRLDRDDCCFFLASHPGEKFFWGSFTAFAKIHRVQFAQ